MGKENTGYITGHTVHFITFISLMDDYWRTKLGSLISKRNAMSKKKGI